MFFESIKCIQYGFKHIYFFKKSVCSVLKNMTWVLLLLLTYFVDQLLECTNSVALK